MPESYFEAFEKSNFFSLFNDKNKLNLNQRSNTIEFAKLLIQNKEFQRAKFFLSKIQLKSSEETFLYYFSWYMVLIQFFKCFFF